jgi:lysophospholipase L1-like esterase
MKKTIGLLSLFLSAVVLAAVPLDVSAFKEPIRVACVGDSITAGSGTTKGNAYPAQLGRMLGEKWVVKNFGVSGATLLNHGDRPYQRQAAFKHALASQPEVVVIKLGTNDTKPQNWKFKNQFVADYRDLIRQFAQLPGKPRIFLCHPAFVPGNGNYGINEAGVLEEIPLLDKLAAEEHLDVIDIHAALKDHPELLPDRVHPNDAGATVMAKAVFQALTGTEFTGPAPVVTADVGGK